MNLFEFLMILLSLIVGLGIAEILTGIAVVLKSEGVRGFSWTHGAATLTVFLGLLQTFWESWGLAFIETWSFPAMLLMLGSPIFLFLMAHVLFPERESKVSLDDHYFERARVIWALAGLTVIVGTLFRPLAFGMPLWILDNITSVPTVSACVLLSFVKMRMLHRVVVPIILVVVLLDTLAISYSIG
jgi:hypothetical protein